MGKSIGLQVYQSYYPVTTIQKKCLGLILRQREREREYFYSTHALRLSVCTTIGLVGSHRIHNAPIVEVWHIVRFCVGVRKNILLLHNATRQRNASQDTMRHQHRNWCINKTSQSRLVSCKLSMSCVISVSILWEPSNPSARATLSSLSVQGQSLMSICV